MLRTYLLFAVLLISVSIGMSQAADEPPTPEKIRDDQQRMQLDMEKARWKELEEAKKTSPEAYKEKKAALTRQVQINDIIKSFHQMTLSQQEARRALEPLVQQEIKNDVQLLDRKIEALQKKLVFLKQARKNPNFFVKKKVDELMGKSPPNPSDMLPDSF